MQSRTTISTDRFAELIGASRQLVHRQFHAAPEALPVQPIRMGARLRWPTAKVARALGLTPEFVVSGHADDLDALAAAMTIEDRVGPDAA